MKFGDQLKEESVPQWGPHNIDYNELKHLIKKHTTKDQSKAITIPGHDDVALQEFEVSFNQELCSQHTRIDLFVRSKTGELNRRLAHSQKEILRTTSSLTYGDGSGPTTRQLEKLDKYDRLITKCRKDTENLERFINAQRTAFRKILKKYKKWTGSSRLTRRFTDEKLDDPKSFTRRSLEALYRQYEEANAAIRLVSPLCSPIRKPKARKQEERVRREQEAEQALNMQRGWNEYDNGSEAGDQEEPYLITIQNNSEYTSFPGVQAFSKIYTKSSDCMRSWFGSSRRSTNPERTPLLSASSTDSAATVTQPPQRREMPLGSRSGYSTITNNDDGRRTTTASSTSLSDDDASDDADDDASSLGFPNTGYATHYATFPSVADQHALTTAERLRSNITIGSFIVAFILLAISWMLLMVGKHKLRMEVDVGVIVGVVASTISACCGMVSMVYKERVSWLWKAITVVAFVMDGGLSGVLLVVVMGNTRFWGK